MVVGSINDIFHSSQLSISSSLQFASICRNGLEIKMQAGEIKVCEERMAAIERAVNAYYQLPDDNELRREYRPMDIELMVIATLYFYTENQLYRQLFFDARKR